MAEGPPTGDQAVFAFLEMIALAFAFAGAERLMDGKSLWNVGIAWTISLVLFIAGVKWPQTKVWIGPRLASSVDRIANDSRYRSRLGLLLLASIGIYAMVYMHSLRNDLDRYVKPRTISRKQSDVLHEHLSHDPHAVTIQVYEHDTEASEFASQLWTALRGAGWDVTYTPTDTAAPVGSPNTFNDGICFDATGDTGLPDSKRDPRLLLQEAFRAANIDVSCGMNGGSGNYKLYILVGHRPVRMGDQQTTLYKLGHWITKMGASGQ